MNVLSRAAALLALGALPLAAQPLTPAPPRDVAFEQKLGAQVPLDLAFRDENGASVKLRDYAGKKPIVLSLVYYECPMLCGMSMTGLAGTMKALTWSAGEEFEVLTVSFDPSEGPELAKGKKESLLSIYTRPSGPSGWHFLTGHEEEIRRLTSAVGFRYIWDADQKQFAHATGVVVLTPDGHVSRYLFGIDVPARDLKLALIEAADGKIGGPAGQLLLLCYHYDPKTGRYGAAAMNLMRAGGVLTLVALAGSFLVLQKRRRRDEMRDAA
jgi:protein SCO1/2